MACCTGINDVLFIMSLTFVRISAEDLGYPDVPKADVGGGADPAEGERVAAVLGLKVHCEQVM